MILKQSKSTSLVFKNYKILKKIADGGMASVYKAKDCRTDQIVAVKVLYDEYAKVPVLVARFEREYKATRDLVHPNIVRSLDYGVSDNRPFLVMEYLEAESIGDILERRGRLPETQAVAVTVQIAQALVCAHQFDLIHRDIKPDNILLTAKGEAKLIDLGLAKDLHSNRNLTRANKCFGTPHFMAPEQFRDARAADSLCDLYSLAASLYMMLTGDLPFRTRSLTDVVGIYRKKLCNELVPPRQQADGISQRVETALLRALRADRTERHVSCLHFLEDLTGEPWLASAAAPAKPRNRRAAIRHSANLESACLPIKASRGDCWPGTTRDVSARGLCLVLKRRFEPGTMLAVELKSRRHQQHTLLVRVVWTNKDAGNHWAHGCTFGRNLTDCELAELTGPCGKQAPTAKA